MIIFQNTLYDGNVSRRSEVIFRNVVKITFRMNLFCHLETETLSRFVTFIALCVTFDGTLKTYFARREHDHDQCPFDTLSHLCH